MTSGLFAWITMNGRLYPERLPADMPVNKAPRDRAVATFPLTAEEMKLPITELMVRYPAPKIEESGTIEHATMTQDQ